MPIPTYYKEIIAAIQSATDEGRVKWRRDEDDFTVTMPEARIYLTSGIDAFRQRRYVVFHLHDKKNNAHDGWAVDEGEEGYQAMYALFMSARLAASGVSPRLDELKELFLHSPSIGECDDTPRQSADRYGT